MSMKITVLDDRKDFHTFTGDNVAFFVSELGVEIVEWNHDDNGERRQRKLGFFATGKYYWVKDTTNARPAAAPQADAPRGQQTVKEPVIQPEPRRDNDPFTQAEMAGEEPLPPDFDVLRKLQEDDAGSDDEELIRRFKERWDKDQPHKMAKPDYDVWRASVPQDELAAALGNAATMLALAKGPQKKRVRNRVKPENNAQTHQEVYAESLKPFKPQTTVDAIREEMAAAEEAPPLLDIEIEPEPDYPDPVTALSEAEARHQRRLACGTCHGTGIIRDPDSEDPLDTMQCTEC